MPKGGDNVLGDAVTEEILTGVARQILEWQHRQRWASGEVARSGESCDLDRFRSRDEPQ